MPNPTIHGKKPVFSASSVLEAIALDLSAIKNEDRLTYADLGAVLGKSEDQAAKYCDGSAAMDAITFGRGKREWNGRFTGRFDRLCVDSRPAVHSDRQAQSSLIKASLAMAEALEDNDQIDVEEVRANRKTLEDARAAIDDQLAKLTVRGAA